jgi:hypothetical protein
MTRQFNNENGLQAQWTRTQAANTWGLAILGQDDVIFIFSNIAAVVRAGQTSVGFWLLSCTFVFQATVTFPYVTKDNLLVAVLEGFS